MHNFNISDAIITGEFVSPTSKTDLLMQAGCLLEKSSAGKIIGDNLFVTSDGELVTATIEVVINKVNHHAGEIGIYAREIRDAGFDYCDNCSGWYKIDDGCPCGGDNLTEQEDADLECQTFRVPVRVTTVEYGEQIVDAPNADAARRFVASGRCDCDIEINEEVMGTTNEEMLDGPTILQKE